ncbi:MAG: pilus (MSHA type) biogenesis protein MshL [Magnetococcales bacterium]|nr:pilus (MSHA type) biogenesis protein MshL [Magnetococcales bacterium]
MKNLRAICLAGCVAVLLSSCASQSKQEDQYDDWTGQGAARLPQTDSSLAQESKQLFEETLAMRERMEKDQPQPVRLEPVRPAPDPMDHTLITLDVTNGEIQHILKALAAQANLNLMMHPSVAEVSNRISVHFKEVPASRVLNHILQIADLHGQMDGNMLTIVPLEERVFHLDFLETEFKTTMTAGGDVLGSSQVEGGSSGLTGSFEIDGELQIKNNPYDQLEEMLQTLVGSVKDPNNQGGDVDSAETVSDAGAQSLVNSAIRQDTATYHLNRLTGTLFVRAKQSVVANVARLIRIFKETLGRQIVIETQIIEVQLSEGHQYGVNWAVLSENLVAGMAVNGIAMDAITATVSGAEISSRGVSVPAVSFSNGQNMLTLGYGNGTVNAAVNLLKSYGEIRILSNPFIRTQHGRPAFISVGTTNSYVSRSPSQILSSTTGESVGTDEQPQVSTVFDGLVVGLVPFIDQDKQISLTIHPIQSSVDADSLELVDVGNDFKLTLPKVDLKELTTTLKMKDGDTVMLGGLIHRIRTNVTERVPILGDLPILGQAFRKDTESESGRELVLIIRVNVI